MRPEEFLFVYFLAASILAGSLFVPFLLWKDAREARKKN